MFPAIKKCSIQSPSDRGEQRHIFQFIKIESKRSNVEFEYVAHKGLCYYSGRNTISSSEGVNSEYYKEQTETKKIYNIMAFLW